MNETADGQDFVPSEASELALSGEAVASKQVVARLETKKHYQHPYAVYVKQFGLQGKDAERALKRWVAKGRETEPVDLPPFDQPEQLGAWWRRHMKWRVPAWMELLEKVGAVDAAKLTGGETKPGESQKDGAKGEEVELPPEFSLQSLAADAGDAERELWQFANGFKAEMESARKRGDKQRWWSAYTEYQKLIKELRSWEKDRLSKRLAAGTALDTSLVTEILTHMFGSLSKTFTNTLLELGRKLAPDKSELELRGMIMPMRDKVFRAVKETRFAATLPEDVAA